MAELKTLETVFYHIVNSNKDKFRIKEREKTVSGNLLIFKYAIPKKEKWKSYLLGRHYAVISISFYKQNYLAEQYAMDRINTQNSMMTGDELLKIAKINRESKSQRKLNMA